jgi:hypothetical protein
MSRDELPLRAIDPPGSPAERAAALRRRVIRVRMLAGRAEEYVATLRGTTELDPDEIGEVFGMVAEEAEAMWPLLPTVACADGNALAPPATGSPASPVQLLRDLDKWLCACNYAAVHPWRQAIGRTLAVHGGERSPAC